MPGLQGWAEKRKTDREGRRPPIGEGRVEFRHAVERTGTGSPIDESAPTMEDGCSSLSRKTAQREEAGLAPSEAFSVPAEGAGSELVSAACKAAREDGPGIAGGDALATGYATAEPQACKQARDSFGRAASGAPSQRVAVASICGLAASAAASPHMGGQQRRRWHDELHFLQVGHLCTLLYLFPMQTEGPARGTDLIASYVTDHWCGGLA